MYDLTAGHLAVLSCRISQRSGWMLKTGYSLLRYTGKYSKIAFCEESKVTENF